MSAGDFDLGRNLRYLRPKTPHFSERGRGGGGKGEGRELTGLSSLVKVKWRSSRGTCAVCHPEILFLNKRAEHIDCQLFYVDDFVSLIPIVSVISKINTHSCDCALGACLNMSTFYVDDFGNLF